MCIDTLFWVQAASDLAQFIQFQRQDLPRGAKQSRLQGTQVKKYNTAISSCNTWKRDVAMPLPHSSYKYLNSVFAKIAKKKEKKTITQLPLS